MEQLTLNEVTDRLQNLAENTRPFRSLLNGTAYILTGEFVVTDETKIQIKERLYKLASTLKGDDFTTVMCAMEQLTPNIIKGDFTGRIPKELA